MAISIGADEKKKLYVLGGLLGAIVVVGAVVFMPKGGGTPDETPAVTTPENAPGAAATTPAAGAPAAAPAMGAPAAAAGAGGSAASLVSVGTYRPDPFKQFEKPKLPPLPQSRTQPIQDYVPPGPVEILPPEEVNILPPGEGETSGGGLPPLAVDGGGGVTKAPILSSKSIGGLPKIVIPRDVAPPVLPRSADGTSGGAGGGGGGIPASPNKRLSGVVIGDSVRATIVMPDGSTRIVQPGDEIDGGIRVLRIERVTEGGRSVTRVIIRENGEERAVVLKAAGAR